MTGQPIPHRYSVSGEGTPRWFTWGLVLLGSAGSVAAALLLAPLLQDMNFQVSWGDRAETQDLRPAPRPLHLDTAQIPEPVDFTVEPLPRRQIDVEPSPPGSAPIMDSSVASIPATTPQRTGPESPLDEVAQPAGSAMTALDLDPAREKETKDRTMPPREAARLPPGSHEQAGGREDTKDMYSSESFEVSVPAAEEAIPSAAVAAPRESPAPLRPESVGPTAGPQPHTPGAEPVRGKKPEPAVALAPMDRSAGDAEEGAEESRGAVSEFPLGDEVADCPPLFTALFRSGSVRPRGSDIAMKIERLAEWLRTHTEVNVIVEGHSDSAGPDDYNLLLSFRRASVVADLLRKAGVPDDHLAMSAYGESLPLEQPAASQNNRRVSLRIHPDPGCPKTVTNGESTP